MPAFRQLHVFPRRTSYTPRRQPVQSRETYYIPILGLRHLVDRAFSEPFLRLLPDSRHRGTSRVFLLRPRRKWRHNRQAPYGPSSHGRRNIYDLALLSIPLFHRGNHRRKPRDLRNEKQGNCILCNFQRPRDNSLIFKRPDALAGLAAQQPARQPGQAASTVLGNKVPREDQFIPLLAAIALGAGCHAPTVGRYRHLSFAKQP
jgi:hypothetical protein